MRFPVSPLAYEVRLGVTRKGSARAQRRRTALADRLQRLQRLVEVADLDQGDPRLRVVQRLRAVAFRREEDGRLGELGGHQLLRDAADLPDPALVVDGAGAGDDLPAGEVDRVELVEYAQREHQAGRGPADPVELDRQGERMRLLLLHPYAEPGVAVLGPGGGQRDLLGLAAADIADHASRAWRLGPDQLAELLYRRHRTGIDVCQPHSPTTGPEVRMVKVDLWYASSSGLSYVDIDHAGRSARPGRAPLRAKLRQAGLAPFGLRLTRPHRDRP